MCTGKDLNQSPLTFSVFLDYLRTGDQNFWCGIIDILKRTQVILMCTLSYLKLGGNWSLYLESPIFFIFID